MSLVKLVQLLKEEKKWLCVISSDEDNKDVNIENECSAIMKDGNKFFTFDVLGGRSYTWMSVAGALEQGMKVFVLNLGDREPSFPNISSFTCLHPVPDGSSYKDHIHATFKDMKKLFDDFE